MSLRITPPTAPTSSTSSTTTTTLTPHLTPQTLTTPPRHPPTTTVTHPLEPRLSQWSATQQSLKLETLRRLFGAAEPIRREMEMKIAGSDWRPAQLGGASGFHLDILRGVDETVEWEDVFKGNENTFEMPGFHAELETKLRMNW